MLVNGVQDITPESKVLVDAMQGFQYGLGGIKPTIALSPRQRRLLAAIIKDPKVAKAFITSLSPKERKLFEALLTAVKSKKLSRSTRKNLVIKLLFILLKWLGIYKPKPTNKLRLRNNKDLLDDGEDSDLDKSKTKRLLNKKRLLLEPPMPLPPKPLCFVFETQNSLELQDLAKAIKNPETGKDFVMSQSHNDRLLLQKALSVFRPKPFDAKYLKSVYADSKKDQDTKRFFSILSLLAKRLVMGQEMQFSNRMRKRAEEILEVLQELELRMYRKGKRKRLGLLAGVLAP